MTGILAFFASQACAVFVDEANVTDWHREQIGIVTDIVPIELDHSEGPSLTSTVFGVYTESNVLAVLNGTNESLLWRRQFSGLIKSHTLTSVDAASTILLSITQGSESTISSRLYQWDARDGALVWEQVFEGDITALKHNSDGSLNVATGHVVHNVDSRSGTIVWSISPEDEGVLFVDFVKHEDTLLAIAKTEQGFMFHPINLADTLFEEISEPFAGSDSTLLHASKGLLAWKEQGVVTIAKVDQSGTILDSVSEPGESILVNKKVAIVTSDTKNVVFDLETLGELHFVDEPASAGLVVGTDDVFVTVNAHGVLSEIEAVSGEVLGQVSLDNTGLPTAIGGKRLALLVQHTNGVLQLVDPTNKNVLWERDESLANAVDALILDLPDFNEGSLGIEELWYEEHTNLLSAFISRTVRHISDLRYLPHALKQWMYSIVSAESPELQLSRANTFGLRKYFVSVSKTGRVTALDTFFRGATAWALNNVPTTGAKVASIDTNIYILCEDGTLTVIDGLEGKITETRHFDLENETIDKFVEAYHEEKTLLAWTSRGRLILVAGPELESFYTTKVNAKSVSGYLYSKGTLSKTWEFSAPDDSTITSSASRNPQDVTINIANVLGDRTVLYKYLHKNILAVAATSASTQNLYVYILDTVTGRILHSKKHEDSMDVSKGVQLVYGENWLVYSFWSDYPTLGEKVVVWDLYESEFPNERASKDTYSSFDEFPLPHVKAQSFFAPSHVTAMTLSRTRFGVTVRDVIASTANNQIIDISKRVLEPRRPVGRKPTDSEMGEGLYTYDAKLQIDSRQQVLSHSRSVLGTRKIATSPARLESTSVVVAYGMDVFYTIVMPSRQFDVLNGSFAKDKLVYTISSMFTIVTYLKPFVAKRMANAKWGVE